MNILLKVVFDLLDALMLSDVILIFSSLYVHLLLHLLLPRGYVPLIRYIILIELNHVRVVVLLLFGRSSEHRVIIVIVKGLEGFLLIVSCQSDFFP